MTDRPCPSGYASRVSARRTAIAMPRPDGDLWWVYRCVRCGLWHLGTEDDRYRAVDQRLYATFAQRRRGGRR